MPLDQRVQEFVAENHKAVLSTFRRDGATQLSIVSCGPYGEGVAFSTTENRAKLLNLERDPRCSLLVSKDDWWGYVVLEGRAEIISSKTASPEKLRDAMRDVYRAASGKEHPDWEEYDEAMRKDGRATVIVIPEKVYGTAL
ncbi:MAG: PPOX class F420-dependent oxidoreductase [Chloroflexi bacterium]|nr:PPOX class F420-dependent oxidoreductase [Chloroflexota bacterium]MCH8816301.1 PPOX class F420-dependent oxidoreductase [Chloroflexota bacterium]